jgi:hypothetical protein
MSHIKQLWTSTQHVTWHFHWKSVCQQLIKMPFTIHLNPGVILPIHTSVHVFCVCYCFILCLHSFFFSFGQNLRGLELPVKNRWHCPFRLLVVQSTCVMYRILVKDTLLYIYQVYTTIYTVYLSAWSLPKIKAIYICLNCKKRSN